MGADGFNRSVAIRVGLTSTGISQACAACGVFQSLGRDSGRSDRLLAPGTDPHLEPGFRHRSELLGHVGQENRPIWILDWATFTSIPVPASGCRIA